MSGPLSGTAAGVPYVALPPRTPTPDAPVVVSWHLLDPPRTPTAMAAAVPMTGLDSWRIHLGLPKTGSRMPPGGPAALMELAATDAVELLFGPLSRAAADEFEPALAELRNRFGIADGRLGLLGGSLGAGVALTVLTETQSPVHAAALVSPLVQLRALVDALGRQFGAPYHWTEPARRTADRLDFVARAGEIAATGAAVALVTGSDDGPETREPAATLAAALSVAGADVVAHEIPGMGHALAEEPGIDAAPQTPHAAAVDRIVTDWFQRHLTRPA
jgi:predicted esterase